MIKSPEPRSAKKISRTRLAQELGISRALVPHLHALGDRRFGWIGGNVGLGRHEARLQALQPALARGALVLDPRTTVSLQEGDRAEGSVTVLPVRPHARRPNFPSD
jgi:DNA-binding LacI/PurR family transcriptional regulator